jgi:hypothetical protein
VRHPAIHGSRFGFPDDISAFLPTVARAKLRLRSNAKLKMPMKKISLLLLGIFALSITLPAIEISQADQKWAEVVAAKVSAGPTEVSTPSEVRVQLAKELAAKKGRACEVVKTSSGFRVVIK